MNMILMILGAIAAIFMVIVLHEAGHFFMARRFGVKVERFSIGFGKVLWSRRDQKGTEYCLSLLPLGGYVKMLGEGTQEILSEAEKPYAFSHKPLLTRAAIVAAGPLTNFLLALILFWAVFLIGVERIKPVIGEIKPQSIAAVAGLKSGQTILSVDGHRTLSWQQVLIRLFYRLGDKGNVMIEAQSSPSASQLYALPLEQWHLNRENASIPFESLGLIPYEPLFPAVIKEIEKNSPAERAGLQPGDQIMRVDQQKVTSWPQLSLYLQQKPSETLLFQVKRNHQLFSMKVTLETKKSWGKSQGYLGVWIQPPEWPADMRVQEQYTLLTAWFPAADQVWTLTAFNAIVLGKMLIGKVSLGLLGGPISIFQQAGAASKAGWLPYLSFIAFMSVTLGFINILPIPMLDGGHLFFYSVEGLIRRPIPVNYQFFLLRLGLILLLWIMIQATINDIMRIFL